MTFEESKKLQEQEFKFLDTKDLKPLLNRNRTIDDIAYNISILYGNEYEGEEFREWKLCYGRQEAYDFIKSFIEQIDLVESYIVSEKNTIEEKVHVIEFLRHVLETGKIEDPGFDPDDYMQGDYDPDEEE